ncbi:MAG TPA: M28 family peptidase [Candidatus Acidoferrales bacterium]
MRAHTPGLAVAATLMTFGLLACGNGPAKSGATGSSEAPAQANATAAADTSGASDALPADKTGGFDGARAYDYTSKIVAIGPRQPNTDGIQREQDFIRAELTKSGCTFDQDDFNSSTPIGSVPMKNIIAKIPGKTNDLILLLTHYDTKVQDNFVGAVDGGSSTGLMLEMAQILCSKKEQPLGVWIAFLDGEEAFKEWSDDDSVYGSRELAARMALSGDLKRIKAVILADMVGPKDLKIRRDSSSTGWLTDLVWSKADAFGYQNYFLNSSRPIEDDHGPFMKRHVAAVDIIDCCTEDFPAWHTSDDTMDKVSARSLGMVGHVILATVDDLQSRTSARQKPQ